MDVIIVYFVRDYICPKGVIISIVTYATWLVQVVRYLLPQVDSPP